MSEGVAQMPTREPIVGRDEELALAERFTGSEPQRATALLIEGEAGAGKSTLWKRTLDLTRATGAEVLVARPGEFETSLPYSALGDLLEPFLDGFLLALPEPQRRALETSLLRVESESPVERLAVGRAVAGALRHLARENRIAVAIDDVQWLDDPSQEVMTFALRRCVDLSLKIFVARRTPGADEPPLALDRTLSRNDLGRIVLGPMTVEGIHSLVESRLGLRLARPEAVELQRMSDGNPFYALEIAGAGHHTREGPSQGRPFTVPASLSQLLHRRLKRLPPGVRDVLLLAATAARPSLELLERAALDPGTLRAAIDEGVLERDEERVRFSHPLLASVTYEEATPRQRRDAHRRLARVAADDVERVRHLTLSQDEPDDDVAGEAERAARAAARVGAPESAAELAEHAARLTPSGDPEARRRRLSIAAEHHISAGNPARGRHLFEEMIAELQPGPERADVLLRLADTIGEDLDEPIRLSRQALDEAGGDDALKARAMLNLAVFHWLQGKLSESCEQVRAAVDFAERSGEQALIGTSLAELAHAETVLGHPLPRATIDPALEIEQEGVEFPPYARPSFHLGVMLLYTDDLTGARPLLEQHLARVTASGDAAARVGVLFRLAELELRAGNWADADAHARECLALASQASVEQEHSVALLTRAVVDAHLGRIEDARAAARRGLELAEAGGDLIVSVRQRGALGFAELSAGDNRTAHEVLAPATRALIDMGIGELSSYLVVHNDLEACVGLGQLEEATELVDLLEATGVETQRPWNLAMTARGAGLIAAARGDSPEAARLMQLALEHHEALPQPFEKARTLFLAGSVERRAKRKRAARALLTEALEAFDRLGAARWSERAAAELARIGGRAPSGAELTPTENRVAQLVARGKSNREVADELFVSVRTVESNLSKVYAKLGVRSRTELVHRLTAAQ